MDSVASILPSMPLGLTEMAKIRVLVRAGNFWLQMEARWKNKFTRE